MSAECVFCGIVAGRVPSRRVAEDEHAVAFLDTSAVTRGHTLVVPRVHAEDIWTIDGRLAAHVMESVHAVARLLRERLNPDGLTLFQANRRAGWQDVFHLHVHVVPRYDGDRLIKPWQVARTNPVELDDVLADLTSPR